MRGANCNVRNTVGPYTCEREQLWETNTNLFSIPPADQRDFLRWDH